MHVDEMIQLNSFKFENRIKSFLIGRYTAKKALQLYSEKNVAQKTLIKNGLFQQSYFVSHDTDKLQVSITHCDDFGGAIIFPLDCPMGIDIEIIARVKKVDSNHKSLMWSAKESLSKILKTGLVIPFEVLEISEINVKDGCLICGYKNFVQYCSISISQKGYLLAIAYPKELKWLNMVEFLSQLNKGCLL